MEFKGTKGKLERKYVSCICIGIGTIGDYSQITANSILPEKDEEYEKEQTEIEATMLLYSKAPEMLEMLKVIYLELDELWKNDDKNIVFNSINSIEIEQLIKEATEI